MHKKLVFFAVFSIHGYFHFNKFINYFGCFIDFIDIHMSLSFIDTFYLDAIVHFHCYYLHINLNTLLPHLPLNPPLNPPLLIFPLHLNHQTTPPRLNQF
jgi:hypothetical protein